MRVLGYARVSTENQLENYSIPQQLSRLEAYCQAKGWELLHAYTDGGFSGGSLDRPALQELLAKVRGGGIDAVLVYKLDRLSRSQKDTLTLIEDEFLAHGTDFISINENFDTSTPFGRAMIGMLSVFAQLERDQITERFTMGRIGRGRAGYFHGGGNPPTGYDYTGGLLQVNEYQAIQVREAYRLFLAGSSINAVSRKLSESYSPAWTPSKVRSVLKNSLYIGRVHFKGREYPGVHRPIIDEDSFREAQELLLGRPGSGRPAFRAGYLLSGLLKCGRCGSRYAAGHGKYACYSRSKNSGKYVRDPDCDNRSWPIPALDGVVLGRLRELMGNPYIIEKLSQPLSPAIRPDPQRTASRLAELDRQLERLLDLYQLGELPRETLVQRARELEKEKAALEAQREAECHREAPRADFMDCFEHSPLDARRAFIGALIQDIVLDGNKVTINWRI